MISQTAEYALRAAVHLASFPDQAQTTQQIATATQVSSGYLSKVLQALGRAGIVQSQRGLHGGFTLLRDPAELTIYDIVDVVDPISRIRTCPLKLKAHGTKLCALHAKLDSAAECVEEAFRSTRLLDLIVEDSDGIRPLCP